MDTPKINNDVVISPTPKDPIQKCTGLWQQINKLFIKYEFVQMNKKKYSRTFPTTALSYLDPNNV